uniref:Uncharacterized protein n=1 Tax=Oryza nivara TaxID=4536 RepID=A0A0E0G366_ORYNI
MTARGVGWGSVDARVARAPVVVAVSVRAAVSGGDALILYYEDEWGQRRGPCLGNPANALPESGMQ